MIDDGYEIRGTRFVWSPELTVHSPIRLINVFNSIVVNVIQCVSQLNLRSPVQLDIMNTIALTELFQPTTRRPLISAIQTVDLVQIRKLTVVRAE